MIGESHIEAQKQALQSRVDLLNNQILVGTGLDASIGESTTEPKKLALFINGLSSQHAKNNIYVFFVNDQNKMVPNMYGRKPFSDDAAFVKHIAWFVAEDLAAYPRSLDDSGLHDGVKKELIKHRKFYQERYSNHARIFNQKSLKIEPVVTKIRQLFEGSHLSVHTTVFEPSEREPKFPDIVITGFSRADLAMMFSRITPVNRYQGAVFHVSEMDIAWSTGFKKDQSTPAPFWLTEESELFNLLKEILEKDTASVKAKARALAAARSKALAKADMKHD